MTHLTAFVLAGGKSTRMGRDKAFLPWQGGTLLSHALQLAASVTPNLRIVGDLEKFSNFGAVIEDIYAERGPLGGIHAALSSSTSDLNLMLAVDLPFIEPRFLHFLAGLAQAANAIVTLPRASGQFQPLCAVYQREFLQAADLALQAGENKIGALFSRLNTRVIEEAEFTRAGFSPDMFRNLNTPEEWNQAQAG